MSATFSAPTVLILTRGYETLLQGSCAVLSVVLVLQLSAYVDRASGAWVAFMHVSTGDVIELRHLSTSHAKPTSWKCFFEPCGLRDPSQTYKFPVFYIQSVMSSRLDVVHGHNQEWRVEGSQGHKKYGQSIFSPGIVKRKATASPKIARRSGPEMTNKEAASGLPSSEYEQYLEAMDDPFSARKTSFNRIKIVAEVNKYYK